MHDVIIVIEMCMKNELLPFVKYLRRKTKTKTKTY